MTTSGMSNQAFNGPATLAYLTLTGESLTGTELSARVRLRQHGHACQAFDPFVFHSAKLSLMGVS